LLSIRLWVYDILKHKTSYNLLSGTLSLSEIFHNFIISSNFKVVTLEMHSLQMHNQSLKKKSKFFLLVPSLIFL